MLIISLNAQELVMPILRFLNSRRSSILDSLTEIFQNRVVCPSWRTNFAISCRRTTDFIDLGIIFLALSRINLRKLMPTDGLIISLETIAVAEQSDVSCTESHGDMRATISDL